MKLLLKLLVDIWNFLWKYPVLLLVWILELIFLGNDPDKRK